jgi:hypothetical protein
LKIGVSGTPMRIQIPNSPTTIPVKNRTRQPQSCIASGVSISDISQPTAAPSNPPIMAPKLATLP